MTTTNKLTLLAATAVLALSMGLARPALAQSPGSMDPDASAKHFKFMDKNKDGALDEKEFKMMGKDYKQQFQDADTNKDGKITPEEYKAWDAKNTQAMPGMKM